MEQEYVLEPPAAIIAEFQSKLTLIDTTFPYLKSVCASYGSRLGAVVVRLEPDAYAQWLAGTFHGFDQLHELIGFESWYIVARELIVISFDQRFNPRVVADLYAEVPGVVRAFADAIGSFDCDPTDIEFESPDRFRFRKVYDGWPCISSEWLIELAPGGPVLIAGPPFPLPSALDSWSAIKAQFRD
jgi:hypothetical protein